MSRPRLWAAPPIAHRLQAELGDVARLLGYALDRAEAKAGERLRLTLYWEALGTPQVSYTVFTHVIDGEGRVWGQQDNAPQQGQAPTTGWLPGEVVVDEYTMPVPAQTPPGSYTIEVGMYDPATGQRLGTSGGEDRVLLAQVKVVR